MSDRPAGAEARPDTQWPRWEVLKKDNERKPHQAVGSVHAADPDHALLMARTVFARRPAAVSMWVAPASSVHSWTAEELAALAAGGAHGAGGRLAAGAEGADPAAEVPAGAAEPAPGPRSYLVVRKSTDRRSMTFGDLVGEVEGDSLEAALRQALERHADEPILALWLIEKEAVIGSDPADADPWFGPAQDKTYKQQSVYSSRATASRDARGGPPR